MSQINVKDAIMRLYDDASLTDELTDEPAKMLLRWAEERLPMLAAQHMDEEAFETAFKTLRGIIKGINRLTGQRATLLPEEQQETLQKMIERSTELGYKARAEQKNIYLEKQAALSEQDNVRALMAWVDTGSPEIAPETIPNEAPMQTQTDYILIKPPTKQEQTLFHGEENQ